MNLWPHQRFGIDATLAHIDAGQRRILVTSPTGGGKSRIMVGLASHYVDQGRKVILYTNRRALLDQTSGVFEEAGLEHGIRAAGHEDERWLDFQIASIQTEGRRMGENWELHKAELVLIDEAHLQGSPTVQKFIAEHIEQGASVVGLTATPIDLGGIYDVLVVAGCNSELRSCGALVPANIYGPDEPDFKGLKNDGGDFTEKELRKALRKEPLFGRVLEWYHRLNPEMKPTLLFASGVEESIWFAEEFSRRGISAAHIDGEMVWINWEREPTTTDARKKVFDGSREGSIRVICNRFVLREGIDAPWLQHGIFATAFGSLQTYLQSGGRLLRSHSSMDSVTIQDHGGNWHRHGSLNSDRVWDLSLTSTMINGLREDRLREKKDKEPFRCPKCSRILIVQKCPCGHEVDTTKRSRYVVQTDGTLREMTGEIYKPRRESKARDAQKNWTACYFRAKNSKTRMNFRQAEALFMRENYFAWPSRMLDLMPVEPIDFYRAVADVPMDRLRNSKRIAQPNI